MTRLTLFEAPEIKAVVILDILDVDIAYTIEMMHIAPKHFPNINHLFN
ncbi:MAG: hypothetical protein J6A54_05740 [Clostridia bacterium]|nr:hypothetical protein [Clostridia bacterium]